MAALDSEAEALSPFPLESLQEVEDGALQELLQQAV